MNVALPLPDAEPVISLQLSTAGFNDTPAHCAELADYLARFAGSGEFDPEAFSTVVSTFLFELLELLFAHHDEGDLALDIFRDKGKEPQLTVRAAVPVSLEQAEFYQRIGARLGAEDAADNYRKILENISTNPGPEAGLLELVALHGVRVSLEAVGPQVVSLTLHLPNIERYVAS